MHVQMHAFFKKKIHIYLQVANSRVAREGYPNCLPVAICGTLAVCNEGKTAGSYITGLQILGGSEKI